MPLLKFSSTLFLFTEHPQADADPNDAPRVPRLLGSTHCTQGGHTRGRNGHQHAHDTSAAGVDRSLDPLPPTPGVSIDQPYLNHLTSWRINCVPPSSRSSLPHSFTPRQVHASLIVVLTRGGSTARLVAKYRPVVPVLTVAVPVLTTGKSHPTLILESHQ